MAVRLTMLEHLKAGVYFDVIRDTHTKLTYSQFGEDSLILDILVHDIQKPHGGFYVDVGAFHPRWISTTRLLKFLNWTGINIDANEEVIALFNRERPEDINVCCGVGSTEGQLVYHMFEGGAVNTLSPDFAELQGKLGAKLIGSKSIPVRTINQILEEKLPVGQPIDYMNIDLEGLDREVLVSLDLSRFRPAVISIEIFGVDILMLGNDSTVSYLRENGYKLAAVARATFIFLDLTQSKVSYD